MRYSLGAVAGFVLKVGLAAMLFFILIKWAAKKTKIRGLEQAAEAA